MTEEGVATARKKPRRRTAKEKMLIALCAICICGTIACPLLFSFALLHSKASLAVWGGVDVVVTVVVSIISMILFLRWSEEK